MNARKKQFQRKISYLLVAVMLLFPMYWLSRPATIGSGDGPTADSRGGSPGGKLARVRSEHNLSQADLGGIDPAGSAMKLSMLGMSGVASGILWNQANSYKDREDWTGHNAVLEQLTKLQPNFSSVWINQGHNLSYNISVEFDDYRDRFHYVMKGIDLLKRGIRHNQKDPKLVNELAFFMGNKVGRSDEYVEFRELFRSPAYDDFYNTDDMQGTLHEGRPSDPRLRDNWLVSKWWYDRAVTLIDKHGAPFKGLNPLLIFNEPSKAQMQYGTAIEEEGVFGDRARQAWKSGADLWADYARRSIPTTLGFSIALGDLEKHRDIEAGLVEELDLLVPGVRDSIVAEKRASLTDQQRAALDKESAERTPDDEYLAYSAERATRVGVEEVIARIKDSEKLEQAQLIADRIRVQKSRGDMARKYREIVNFEAWQVRAAVEQLETTIAAREAIYLGDQAYRESDLTKALNQYNKGFDAWGEVLKKHPELLQEAVMVQDLVDVIKQYVVILGQNNLQMPADFPLQSVIEVYHETGLAQQDDEPLPRYRGPRQQPPKEADSKPEQEPKPEEKPADDSDVHPEPDSKRPESETNNASQPAIDEATE